MTEPIARRCRKSLHDLDLPGARCPDGRCRACRRAYQQTLEYRAYDRVRHQTRYWRDPDSEYREAVAARVARWREEHPAKYEISRQHRRARRALGG